MKESISISDNAWEIIDQVESAELGAQRLKAVTGAFAELFTRHTAGDNAKAVAGSPEQFCHLFSVIELLVEELNRTTAAAGVACNAYLSEERAKAKETA